MLGLSLPVLIALEAAGGALGLATDRARARPSGGPARARRRDYARYVLHLSPHDEAKPQDVEDLMEAIAHLVRAFPADRARHGQPYVALELDHGPGPSGELEWSLARPLPARGSPSRSTARSAPPTPTSASAASPANARSPPRRRPASPGT